MAQDFWLRWQKIYLPTLIPRKKWNSPQQNFKESDHILLKVYNMVKKWSRGRVHKIIPNKDGKVRCLEIKKTDGSVLLRDVRTM